MNSSSWRTRIHVFYVVNNMAVPGFTSASTAVILAWFFSEYLDLGTQRVNCSFINGNTCIFLEVLFNSFPLSFIDDSWEHWCQKQVSKTWISGMLLFTHVLYTCFWYKKTQFTISSGDCFLWLGNQGPVLLQGSDTVASLSANGSAAFKESCTPTG